MQSVFADAVNDAAKRGPVAVAILCAREMWELPRNVVREHWGSFQKGNVGMNDTAVFYDQPSSWLGTLIGALPFLLLGPITVLLAYPYPYPTWRTSEGFVALVNIIYPLGLLIGLAAGWRARWPRWSFPYLCVGILVSYTWIAQSVVPLVFRVGLEWPLFGQIVYALGIFALVLATVLGLMRAARWLRPLYSSIRQDWTLLSFGLSVASAFMLSGIDHEEDPRLTLAVILPGMIVLLSAVAHLRSTNKIQRILSLALGLFVAVAVSALRHWFYLFYGTILAGIVFLPALLELLRPQSKPMLTE